MKRHSRVADWGLLILCNLMWASQYVMARIVQEQMGPVFATFLPITIATLLLIPIVIYGRRKGSGDYHQGDIPRRDVMAFIVIGVCGQIPAQLFITWGVGWALASNAALIALTLPILTALMAYFMLGERMTRLRWISFALALVGAVECSGIQWGELNFGKSKFVLGNVLIFLGIAGSAFYNVYSKKLLVRYSSVEVQLYSYYAVVACILPITLVAEPGGFANLPHFTMTVWAALLVLALFVYLLSMLIFLHVLSRMDAIQAGLSNYMIPFFGLILASILLHERLTGFMVIGGVLVLVSTLLMTVFENRQWLQSVG